MKPSGKRFSNWLKEALNLLSIEPYIIEYQHFLCYGNFTLHIWKKQAIIEK
jgi:hypothetical protein